MHEYCTENGEITYDTETKQYTIWNETYSDIVDTVDNIEKAKQILADYCKYLEGTKHYGT
jgi:hypothetical protein